MSLAPGTTLSRPEAAAPSRAGESDSVRSGRARSSRRSHATIVPGLTRGTATGQLTIGGPGGAAARARPGAAGDPATAAPGRRRGPARTRSGPDGPGPDQPGKAPDGPGPNQPGKAPDGPGPDQPGTAPQRL